MQSLTIFLIGTKSGVLHVKTLSIQNGKFLYQDYILREGNFLSRSLFCSPKDKTFL